MDKINIDTLPETNVDWFENGEPATADVFNRPIKQISEKVNEIIDNIGNADKLDGYDSADFMRFAQLTGTIGNLSAPLLSLPLKKNLLTQQGQSVCTFTRASAATYTDRYGVLKSVAADTPRFTADGLLIEGASTNLLTYSEQFDNAAWVKAGASVTANTAAVTDPYGTNLADKLVEDTSTGNHQVNQIFATTAGSTTTRSVFLKAGERSRAYIHSYNGTANVGAYFDLSAGTVISSDSGVTAVIKQFANGWYRCSITLTETATSERLQVRLVSTGTTTTYTGDGTSGLYIFGAQFEATPFATSYIPTTTTSATRVSNNFSIQQSENLPPHSSTFSYSLDFAYNGQSTANLDFLFADGTTDFRAFIQNNTLRVNINNIQLTAVISPNTKYRMILVGGSTTLYLYLNGALISSGAMGAKVSNKASLYVGSYNGASNHLFGTISNLRIYDRALKAEEVRLA